MIKATVLYEHRDNTDEFDSYYFANHVALVGKMPDIESFEAVVYGPGPDGAAPRYHLIAGLYFKDAATLQASLGSPEGQAVTADVLNFPEGWKTPTVLVGEVA